MTDEVSVEAGLFLAGYLSGAAGFRGELWAHRAHLPRLLFFALCGGGAGAWLLLQTAEAAFSRAVPWLLLVATMLLIWGESLQALLYRHFGHRQSFSTASQFLLILFLSRSARMADFLMRASESFFWGTSLWLAITIFI